MANWTLRTSLKLTTGVKYQFHQGFFYQIRDPEIPITLCSQSQDNKIVNPAGNRTQAAGLEGRVSTDHATATNCYCFIILFKNIMKTETVDGHREWFG